MSCKREIKTFEGTKGTIRERCVGLVEKLPFPDKNDENWKHTDLKNYLNVEECLEKESFSPLNFKDLVYNEKGKYSEGEDSIRIIIGEDGETEVIGNNESVEIKPIDAISSGTIEWALDNNLVRYSPDALLRAFYAVGIYIKVVKSKIPVKNKPLKIEIVNRFAGVDVKVNRSIFVWLLVEIEAGTRVILSEGTDGVNRNAHLFSETDIFLHESASVDYVNYSDGDFEFHRHKKAVLLENGSRLNLYSFAGRNGVFRGETEVFLNSSGVEVLMREAFVSPRGSRKDFVTLQHHRKGFSRSNLLLIGAIGEGSGGDFTGTIRVDREAQKTDAYQRSKMMLLSRGAHAGSVPRLEILADDVKCSHGASIGEVDEDTLFYLMSRGLDRKKAVVMALEGFFGDFVDKLPEIPLKSRIESAIQRDLKELVGFE